jgi:hypothetical protein
MSILFKTLTGLNSEPAVPEVKPLTLRNIGTTPGNFQLSKTGSPTVDGLQYRMEGEKSWLPYTINTGITVNPNEAVQFQNTNETLSTSTSNYVRCYSSCSSVKAER